MNQNAVAKSGIGGWLILPAIGLALSPILSVVGIIQQVDLLSSSQYASAVSQYPGLGPLTHFELLGKLVLFVFVCVVAYSFFKKKSTAPRNITSYLLAVLAFGVARFVWGLAIFGGDDALVLVSLLQSTNIIGLGLASAIWIPYFRESKRVKATFVN